MTQIATEFAAFVEQDRTHKGPRCSVGILPSEVRTLIEGSGSEITSSVLAKFLTVKGHKVNATTVARHRRRDCNCARSDG